MKKHFVMTFIISILGILNANAYWPSWLQNGKEYAATHLLLGEAKSEFDGTIGFIRLNNDAVDICNFTICKDGGDTQLVSLSTLEPFSNPDSNGSMVSTDMYENEVRLSPMKSLGKNVYALTFVFPGLDEVVSVIFDISKVIK